MPKTPVAYTLDVTIRVKIGADDIESMLISAFTSGVHGASYWCRLGDREENMDSDELIRRLIDGGVTVVEEDTDGNGVAHKLTLDKLRRGFTLWIVHGHVASQYRYLRGLKADGTLDLDIDGPQADVILQYALLGEQVYG